MFINFLLCVTYLEYSLFGYLLNMYTQKQHRMKERVIFFRIRYYIASVIMAQIPTKYPLMQTICSKTN